MDVQTLFEALIRENTGMLMAYIRAGIRDEHAADDVYQETVLAAWKRLDDYDTQKPLGPWLRGIASKVMLAHHRKSARLACPLDEGVIAWLNDRFAAIHNLQGDTFDEKIATLRECIDALPDTYKHPVRMRYTEQKALAEVQSTLDLAAETLRKRLTRAKLRLAECLERKLGIRKASA
ncbi:MAG TPA: RNA polymerase factor sigma-70 [Planctomycetaceae bacterium]|nr:RNA polymerase factor sigma-70 [Planctomycetaceae bacterium]